MSFEVKKEVFSEYFIMSASGEYSFETMLDHVDRIKQEADNLGLHRVLIDAGNFTGKMNEAERFLGGQKIAEVFGGKLKAAMVLPENQITKLGETVAINRGAKFFVTASKDEAVEWLLNN